MSEFQIGDIVVIALSDDADIEGAVISVDDDNDSMLVRDGDSDVYRGHASDAELLTRKDRST